MRTRRAVLISMSGVRVYNDRLREKGLTLPGFVERSRVIASLPSLGLLTLAAYSPEHWDSIYLEIDERDGGEVESILRHRPDVVAFSSLSARILETYELADQLREAGVPVVIGGLHATAMPAEASAHADAVVQGEGELLWPVLLRDLENGSLRPFYSSLRNSDTSFLFRDFKMPRYDLLQIERYNRITIQTTRGCPLDCSFCAASRTISSYKKKPLDQVAAELDAIHEIWDKPFLELADDNTFIDKAWSRDLVRLFGRYPTMRWFTECDVSLASDPELLDLLAETRCAQVLIGFESATPVALQGLSRHDWKWRQWESYIAAIKRIQSRGISVNGCFILGFDTDTEEAFDDTFDFIRESDLTEAQITILTPFPGTALHRQLERENRLLEPVYWDRCTLFDVTYQPAQMSVLELEQGFEQLMTRVYAPAEVQRRKGLHREVLKSHKEKCASQ